MKLSNFLIFIYASILVAMPEKIFAQSSTDILCDLDYSLGGQTSAGTATGPARCVPVETAMTNALDNVIDRLPFYLTGLAFFAFLYSGGMYIFSLGDANKQETAKKNLMWTVTGMIVMALISIIIRFATFIGTAARLPGMTDGAVPGIL